MEKRACGHEFLFLSRFILTKIWRNCFFFIYRVSTNMSLLSTWLKTALVLSLTLRKSWKLGLKCSLVVKWEADPSKVYIFIFPYIFFFFKKKPAQHLRSLYYHTYLLFWPSFIRRNFFERKNFSRLHSKKQNGYWKNWTL